MTIFCGPTTDTFIDPKEERKWWEEGVKAQNAVWNEQSATEKTEGTVKTKIAKITAPKTKSKSKK